MAQHGHEKPVIPDRFAPSPTSRHNELRRVRLPTISPARSSKHRFQPGQTLRVANGPAIAIFFLFWPFSLNGFFYRRFVGSIRAKTPTIPTEATITDLPDTVGPASLALWSALGVGCGDS